MSARRRPGSWQDEVARSFSRLFSRGTSQDKEEDGATEEPEKTDRSLARLFFRSTSQERGPQEEQERSPSRLFLRKVSQDGKGASAENGGARDPQEEQERARGFSRLFSRTSSQEKQEEDHNKLRAGEEDQHRHEEKKSDLALDSHERLSLNQTEEINEDQSSSSPRQVTFESEEEKDTEFRENSKVLDSEKQSRENFFHFIGNLFHFTPKTSLGNAKQVDSTQDLYKEHEDVQVKNNLDKEDSHWEHTQDVSTGETEQTTEFSPAQTEPSEESNTEPPKETIKLEQQETPTLRPKINGYPQEAPAVTYGTYRGSRRIRKLLKRRADVNSPIPEKEETGEKETGTEDVDTESCYMLHEIVSMEPVLYRSSEEEMPPSKIQIKMKMPVGQAIAQIVESNLQGVEDLKHNTEDSPKVSVPSQNSGLDLHEDDDLKRNADESSIVYAPSQNSELDLHEDEDLKRNADESSIVYAPSENSELDLHEDEDLKRNADDNSIVSTSSGNRILDLQEDEKQSADDSSILSVSFGNKSLDLQEDEDLKLSAKDSSILPVTSKTSKLDLHEDEDFKQTTEGSSTVSVPSGDSESDLHEDNNLNQNVDVGSLVAVLNHNGESNSHEDMTQDLDIIATKSVTKQNDECLSDEVEKNVGVNFDVLKSQETYSLDSSAILEDMQQRTEEKSKISNNAQLHAEEPSDVLASSSLDNVNSLNASKEFQPHLETNSNISEDIHLKAESKLGCSVELDSSVLSKISMDLAQGADKSLNISQSQQVNTEKSLDSSKDLQSSFHHDSDFSLDLSPHNDDRENMFVVYQTNSEERLEDLKPNDLQQNLEKSMQISGDVQSTGELNSNILECLQINSAETSKILKTLQPNKDEIPKNLHKLKQVCENSSTIVQGNDLDLQPLPTENTKSVKMSKNVSQILNNENLDSRNNVETMEIQQQFDFENKTNISFDSHFELANVHEVEDLIPSSEGISILSVQPHNSESGLHNDKDLKQNVHVGSLVSVLNHENLDSKQNVETLDTQQVNTENSTKISFEPHSEKIKLAVSSQRSQVNTSFTQDLHTNFGSKNMQKEHQSEQFNNKIHKEKLDENLDRLLNTMPGTILEGTVVNESPLASDKSPTQEETCNAESNLKNQQKLFEEDDQFIEVEHLTVTEELQLNPSENRNVSEQPQPKVEDMPKITAELEPYENMQLDFQKDLQQFEERHTNVISEATVDSTIQRKDVSQQKIVINGELTVKDNFQQNEQGKSIIIDKTLVIAQPDLKISKDPETTAEGFPIIAGEQHENVKTSGNTLNKFHSISSTDDVTSEIISVIDNAQGKSKSENLLNNGSSHVLETIRTVSFDNGIECQSPSPTIPGSPSSTDSTDIRCDSPLPLSDAIDSGMVSSQAYTPEDHIPITILPPDIFSKSISNPSYIRQKEEKNGHVESIVENVENTLPVPVAPFLDNAVKKQNERLIEETGSQAAAKSSPSVEHVFYVDNDGPDVDGDISGRYLTNEINKLNLNSDVFIAKVSVKSVNIEEVKLAPCEFLSDIISVNKVESATYDKELICVPDFSPLPVEPEYDSKFEDLNSKGQQDEENSVTNIEVPSDRNIKDLTVNNANLSFCEPSLFLDFNNCEKSPYNCYVETERFPSLKEINAVENVVNMFSNDYVGDNVPHYTYLEKGLQTLPAKSSDVLIENLKNNNLRIGTNDDIINISLQTNTSESELANDALMSDDSCWGLQSCDSLPESHPSGNVTHKEPVKERDVILQSTFQRDVNCTDGINSSDSTTSKMSLPNTEHSMLSSELFEKKASEIIFSVLHSAIDEFQNLNKNHVPSLSTDKETLVGNHLSCILEVHSAEDEAEAVEKSSTNVQKLTTDPVISTIASSLVSDVIRASKQSIQINLDKANGTNYNGCTQTSMVIVNGPDEDTRQSKKNISLLDVNSSELLNPHEVNSNVLQPIPTCDLYEGTEEGNDHKLTMDTKEGLNDSRHLDIEALHNRACIQADNFSNLEAMVKDDTENKNLRFDLGCDGDQEGYYSKSLETEGSMDTSFINNLLGENSCISGTEFIDPFQFSLYNSKYVEIESDDESIEEESGNNGQISATDMFLALQSRRVRIYPLSLSPIYEDDSSCEDAVSNSSSPRFKKGTATGGSSNDPTSILSLLQSVSDRLKEANIEEVNMTSTSEAAAVSDPENTGATGAQEDKLAPPKSNLDSQEMLLEETSGEKGSGLFITKAGNKVNPGSGRQSFLISFGSKPSTDTDSAAAENKPSPTATSESSSIHNKDMSADVITVTPLSSLQMVTDSGLSAPKLEIKCQPRMSSQSVYYQYFNSTQNLLDTENKESSTQEKVALPTEGESKEIKHQNNMDSGSLKFNPRPGKVILSDVIHHENKIELKGDILDATSLVFPNGVNIRVIRGCWIMYEKPHFEGQAHVLEEGEAVLLHLWDSPQARAKPDKISIGSVKRVVKDYLPEVVISPLEGTSDCPVYIYSEVPSLENLVDRRPRSLTVNSGVWLMYTEPQYNGTVSVLEEGCELPQIRECGVKSMRPLKMGGLKVQLPNDPKIIIYEKPHFQGWSREITEHVSNIEKRISDGDHNDPIDVGSIRVHGGIWVGYEKERYKGYQYLLEEGEYEDWQAWGGYSSTLQSIRYLQANFLEASVTLLESDSEDGKHVDLFNQAIPDLELAGYNTKPQCIHVKKGMWVAYQQKHYCGQQYILEKGRYKSHIDWGGSSNTIMSIRPVLLEPLGRNEEKNLIKAYKNANFQGESVDFTQQVSDFISFMPKSFKVLRGCWLLCYQANGCDNMCVLEEGHYPDLASCGCPAPEIKSIQPIDYVFAEPSISLFSLDSCEGRELNFEEPVTSILSEELYTQSVWVRRGLWIAFEGANFLGRQTLLEPQQIHYWSKFSGWNVIGSIRPLKQPAVYFMVRNRHRDKYLTVTGKLSDSRATFVSISSRNGQSSQIWYFSRGFLKSKANDSCLDVIGGKNIPGSKVSLWAEHGKIRQKWKINKDGTISSYISDDLVLDVKGGNYYDQNYLIVNRAQESAVTQKWDIEIL